MVGKVERMGKKGKEAARERREQRLQQIGLLRTIPYQPHERWWEWEEPHPNTNTNTNSNEREEEEEEKRAVAVVTGGSRGIGYEIGRQLALHGLHVVLASRQPRGEGPQEEEGGMRGSVEWQQLDIRDAASVDAFASWAALTHGSIHLLVNNAGVNFNSGAGNSVEFAEQVMETNYFGTKRMIEAMIPIMAPSPFGARIVNVSSRLGRVNGRRNRVSDASLREQLLNDDCLSEELIDEMVRRFLEQVKQGSWFSNGWPQMYTDYSISKLALNAYTRVMARRLSDRPEGQKIYMNCFCPGWVKTAMTNWAGNISAEEGADTGVWLALRGPDQATTGRFFAERREISF